MGRAAKATRGGNKRRINPARLAKKFTQKHGMSERSAGIAARAAAKMSLAAPRDRAAALANLPPKMAKRAAAAVKTTTANKAGSIAAGPQSGNADAAAPSNSRQQQQQQQAVRPAAAVTGVKAQIQTALAQLQQQRNLQEQRTVVKQAARRTKK